MTKRVLQAATFAGLISAVAPVALAAEPTVVNGEPELQAYGCGADWVSASWTADFSGGTGTYSWSLAFGDGTSTSGTATGTISRSHLFHPHFACRDYNQSFNASSAGGGSSYDGTRVIYQR